MPDPYEALRKARAIEPEPGLLEQAIALLVGGLGLSGVPVPTATGPARAMGDTRASRLGEALAILAGVPVAGTVRKGIKAYHGSPHDFDKFSLAKIGTGEGAQAYGHGLYFAENEGVAKGYRDALAVRNAPVGMPPDVMIEWGKRQPGRMYEVNIHADPETLLDWDTPVGMQGESVRNNPLIRELQAAEHYGYSMNEWRALPAERREHLMQHVPGGAKVTAPGARIYDTLASELGGDNPAAASTALKQAGIPGIRYLDAGSRMTAGVNKLGDKWFIKGSMTPYATEEAARAAAEAAGNATRNYVIFDADLVDIMRKYGLLPPLAAGLAGKSDAR